MKTILVHFAEAEWTNEAVFQACVLARNSKARVVMIRLIQVPYASYLGTDFGFIPADPHEVRRLDDYAATAEDCGVELTVEPMQCISSLDALVQAVDIFDADLLFAHVPQSWLPLWHRYQVWRMVQQLGSRLITLDQPMIAPEDEALTIDRIIHPPLAGSLPPAR